MTKQINYEDDIFFLLLIIRRLRDGLKLKIDMETFGSKIVDDILFLDETIEKMLQMLEAKHGVLNREENLRSLKKVESLFNNLLDDIIEKRIPGSYYFSDLNSSFIKIRKKNLEMTSKIDQILSDMSRIDSEKSKMVSEEEFRYLLSSDDNENE